MNRVDYVIGQKYVPEVASEGGGVIGTVEDIFVPECQLNISNKWGVTKQERPSETKAAWKAAQAVMEQEAAELKSRGWRTRTSPAVVRTPEYIEFRDRWAAMAVTAQEEANRDAFTPVSIPKDFIDRIKALYEESVDDTVPQGRVRVVKAEILQMIHDSGLLARPSDDDDASPWDPST